MAWLRLDDLFLDHPKIVGLTDKQLRVHIAGMLYASRHETLGRLNKHALRRIGATAKVQEALIEARVWKRPDGCDDEIVIHEFVSYNGRTQEERVAAYLSDHPEATANEVARVVGGNRQHALKLVEKAKADGSQEPPDPGSTEPPGYRYQGTTSERSDAVPVPTPPPTPAPAGQRADSDTSKGRSEASYAEPHATTNGLPFDKELLLAELLRWIGDDADERTGAVLRHNLEESPEAVVGRMREAMRTIRPRNRARWAVAVIKAETNAARERQAS